MPLTADSTIGEWLSDPRGAELLGEVFMAMMAADDGGAMGTMAADPATMQMMMSFPIGRVSAFPGSPITPETIAELVEAANRPAATSARTER